MYAKIHTTAPRAGMMNRKACNEMLPMMARVTYRQFMRESKYVFVFCSVMDVPLACYVVAIPCAV